MARRRRERMSEGKNGNVNKSAVEIYPKFECVKKSL